MSLRDKARDIKAAGEGERGNFTPTGAPLRVYKYWYDRVRWDKRPKRENFCHFWRVVAIWAPLMFLGNKIADAFESTVVLIGSIILAVLVVLFVVVASGGAAILLFGAAILLGIAYFCLGIITGMMWGLEEVKPESERVTKAVAGVTFVVSLPAYLASRLYKRYPDFVKDALTVVIFLAMLFVVGVLLVQLFLAVGLLVFVGIFALAVLAVVLGVFGVPAIGRRVQGRRALARQQEEEREPAPATVREPRESSWLTRFVSRVFTGLGDFLILAAQVAQVKKWKICPLVEIPTDNDTVRD